MSAIVSRSQTGKHLLLALVAPIVLCMIPVDTMSATLSAVDSREGRVLLLNRQNPERGGLPQTAVIGKTRGSGRQVADVASLSANRMHPMSQMSDMRNPFGWPGEPLSSEDAPLAESASIAMLFGEMNLSCILYDRAMPLAIIDDNLLGVGEQVNGATVRTIAANEVVLEKNGRFHTLRFSELFQLELAD